jgi:hypothetical protein
MEVAHTHAIYKQGARTCSRNRGAIFSKCLRRCRNSGTKDDRPVPIHVPAIALEAERVIAVPLHDAPVAEEGASGLALPANVLDGGRALSESES